MLNGLYGISDEILTPYDTIFDSLDKAVLGGMKIFQLRDKSHRDNELFGISVKIRDFCIQRNVLFVINDRIDLANAINAEALHIGGEDCDLKIARKNFSGKIGVSCYDSLDLALKAQEGGADYVAFGAFFPSKTKPNAKKASLDTLLEAKKRLKIPICAIGGIDDENVSMLKSADMIAVIGSLWSGNIEKNAEKLIEKWQGN